MLPNSTLFSSAKMPSPTVEMQDFFEIRTKAHKERVRKNIQTMAGFKELPFDILDERGRIHDESKFFNPERDGYIWLTWMHHCKNKGIPFEYPAGIANEVEKACQHHLKNNRHHFEAHENPDAMDLLDLVEMVCDWTAMSQEYNQNNGSCKEYVNNNIDKKWNFSAETKMLIYIIIDELDMRNKVLSQQSQNFVKPVCN